MQCRKVPIIAAMTYVPPPWLSRAGHAFGVPEVWHVPGFLGAARADALLAETLAASGWQSEEFTLFGRQVVAPRLTAWYGDAGVAYRYSGVARAAAPWPPALRELADEVGRAVAWRFNYVLVNRYRNGDDMLGWHADDEAGLGPAPVIAAVGVGTERRFRLRPRHAGKSVGGTLGHGSLLLMWGRSQHDYKHCVPRTRKAIGERVTFTFRYVHAS